MTEIKTEIEKLKAIRVLLGKTRREIYKELNKAGLNMSWRKFLKLYYNEKPIKLSEEQIRLIENYYKGCLQTLEKTAPVKEESVKAREPVCSKESAVYEPHYVPVSTAEGVFTTFGLRYKNWLNTDISLVGYGISKSGNVFRVLVAGNEAYLITGDYTGQDCLNLGNRISYRKLFKALRALGWIILYDGS